MKKTAPAPPWIRLVAAPPVLATALVAAPPPLSLGELIQLALARNSSLRAAGLETEAQAATAAAARGLFDPTLGLAVSRGASRLQGVLPEGGPAALDQTSNQASATLSALAPWGTQATFGYQALRAGQSPINGLATQNYPVEWTAGLTLSVAQPLLRGAGRSLVRADLDRADRNLRAAQARQREQAILVAAAVAQAHATYLWTRDVEIARQEGLRRSRDLERLSQELVDLKLLASADLITGRKAVSARQAAATVAGSARADAADALLGLVLGPTTTQDRAAYLPRLGTDTQATPAFPGLPPGATCEARALARRGQLEAGREDLAALQIGRRVAQDALRPSLSLTASYQLTGKYNERALLAAGQRPYDQGLQGWTVGLALALPLGNRTARGSLAALDARVRGQELAVASTEEAVRADARTARRGLEAAQAEVQDAVQALDLARQALEAATARQRLGLVDLFRLVQVDDEVTAAEVAQAEARYRFRSALARFHAAVGDAPERFEGPPEN